MDPTVQPKAATEILHSIQSRQTSCLAVLESFIAKYEEINPQLNAIVIQDFQRARQRAAEADRASDQGISWGPLHGLPMTVKEQMEIAGLPCCQGKKDQNVVSTRNSPAVQKLIDAGAIIFGKTNVPVGCLDWETYNDVYGKTRNPFDLTRSCGGSSGGCAAAVGGGLSPLELGSDLAGSIRVPSAFCGVFGHVPTYELVPYDHLDKYTGTTDMAVVGPIASSAQDLQLAMSVLVTNPAVLATLEGPNKYFKGRGQVFQTPKKDISNYKISLLKNHSKCKISKEIEILIEKAIQKMVEAKAEVKIESEDFMNLEESLRVYMALLGTRSCGSTTKPDYTEDIKVAAARDDKILQSYFSHMEVSHADWIKLNHARNQHKGSFTEYFKSTDLLICPIVPCVAFPAQEPPLKNAYFAGRVLDIDGIERMDFLMDPLVLRDRRRVVLQRHFCSNLSLCCFWSNAVIRNYSDLFFWPHIPMMSGFPATEVPIGRTPNGLPVGIQIIGPAYSDNFTIHLAKELASLLSSNYMEINAQKPTASSGIPELFV